MNQIEEILSVYGGPHALAQYRREQAELRELREAKQGAQTPDEPAGEPRPYVDPDAVENREWRGSRD